MQSSRDDFRLQMEGGRVGDTMIRSTLMGWTAPYGIELAALLHLPGSKNAASLGEAARSVLLVAGTRNHLYRTTITALSRR